MKASTAKTEPVTRPQMEKRFEKFGKALMAVPKKKLDKELAKGEGKKKQDKRRKPK